MCAVGLPKLRFFTFPVINFECGVMMRCLSKVSIRVERTAIFLTMPEYSPTSIQSPSFIGRSINRTMSLVKFSTTDCRPKPSPTDKRTGEEGELGQVEPGGGQGEGRRQDNPDVADS